MVGVYDNRIVIDLDPLNSRLCLVVCSWLLSRSMLVIELLKLSDD